MPIISGEGGGAAAVVAKTSVTLTNAQIKALPTAPIEIVAAPGTGKMLLLVQGLLAWDDYSNAVPYTNVSAVVNGSAFAAIFYDAVTAGTAASALVIDDLTTDNVYRNFWAGIDDLLTLTPNAVVGAQSAAGGESPDRHSSAKNLGLFLSVANPLGNFTGGDAINSITVTLLTATVDVL